MLISGIKSKPVYRTLAPDVSGLRHLFLAQGQGGEAICRLYDAFRDDPTRIEIYYTSESILGLDCTRPVQELSAAHTHIYSCCSDLENALKKLFSSAQMGIRLYICGAEPFIWAVTNLAFEFGIRDDEIQQEHADSHARQVSCVHCNALMYPVRTNIICCPGCGRNLLVRDHFSRRINAYMGVQIDAEVRGEIPKIVEVYVP